ncbi:MAG: tetratricopeptide repeat protein [Lachnospiraceae bacterium]|nr:tetratricopeptide repeat protein [Lachnospiraceae bacterium]
MSKSKNTASGRRKRSSGGGKRRITALVAVIVLIAAVAASVLIIGKLKSRGSEMNSKGLLAYEEGDYETALAYFDQALSYDDDDPGILLNKAQTLTAMGRYKEALAVYDDALRRSSSAGIIEKAFRGKAYTYYALDDKANAETYLEKLMEYGYAYYGDNGLYGIILYSDGQTDRAMEQFDIYLAAAPDGDILMRDVLFARVCYYEYRKDWSEAGKAVNRLLEKYPDDEEGLHEKTFIESRLQ